MKRTLSFFLALCLLLCGGMLPAQAADKVYALTMGVRKYDVNNTVSDGASVAVVTYTRLSDGSTGTANKIFDVQPGEEFDLTTQLADGQEDYYVFIGWFDGDGALISREDMLHVVMDSSKAVFAAYGEIANSHIVTYRCTGEGDISISSNMAFQDGVGCASVLHGADVTVSFKPAKNYTFLYIKVNSRRVSMLSCTMQACAEAVQNGKIKDVFGVLFNYVKFLIGQKAKLTVKNITEDTTIEVGFMKKAF